MAGPSTLAIRGLRSSDTEGLQFPLSYLTKQIVHRVEPEPERKQERLIRRAPRESPLDSGESWSGSRTTPKLRSRCRLVRQLVHDQAHPVGHKRSGVSLRALHRSRESSVLHVEG
jgi:hypothetical protein